MRSNIIAAAIVGLVLGVAAELIFGFAERVPLLGCLFAPLAVVIGLGLPILIGYLAAGWGSGRGLMSTPSGMVDGAAAAALAELVNRVIGLVAGLVAAQSIFLGPRFLLPSVTRATGFIFSGIWALGWLVASVAVAALLGAGGGLLYNATNRR